MSVWKILCKVIDGEVKTREQAQALVAEDAAHIAKQVGISEEQARICLLRNLADIAHLYHSPANQAKIDDLFQLSKEGE